MRSRLGWSKQFGIFRCPHFFCVGAWRQLLRVDWLTNELVLTAFLTAFTLGT